MQKDSFFVEGSADKKFIIDLFKKFFPKYLLNPKRVFDVGGWTNLPKSHPHFSETKDAGGKNIILFDADSSPEMRRAEIIEKKPSDVDFQIFLFPNNSGLGNLESLLEAMTLPKHQKIMECFNGYCDCLKENPDYRVPESKVKIFAYASVLAKDENEAKDAKRDYLNTDIWDMDVSELKALRDFIFDQIDYGSL